MKKLVFILALLCLEKALQAQTPKKPLLYTITADSVYITNTCDTAELIIENHTQHVPGFLFNKGRGRTEFRRVLQKINDTLYTIGSDSLKIPNAWVQGGNAWGTTGVFGTRDNNPIDFYTNNVRRGRWTNTGNLLLGSTTDNGNYKLQVNGTIFGNIYTNSPTALGDAGAGALRLRWGGSAGTYIEFYYQENTNRRGYISSPADNRPLTILDSVGLTVATGLFVTPFKGSTTDALAVIRTDALNGQPQYCLYVKPSGNTVVGSYIDNGNKLQVNGTSWFGNDVYVYHPTFQTGGIGGGMRWVGDNTFRIYGGLSESLTFGPSNMITSSAAVAAPCFSVIGTNPTYYVPASGGTYNTMNGPGNTGTYHTFTNQPPAPNSGNGAPVLMQLNKVVNRGEQDGLETALRIDFTVTGTASNLRALETVNGNVKLNTSSGKTSVGVDNTSAPTSQLDVNGQQGYNQLRLRKNYTPTSSSDTNGNVGDVSWDDNYIYIKTSTGWKRTALSTF